MKNDIDENKACRSVWGSLLNTYPQSFVVHCHEAMGGNKSRETFLSNPPILIEGSWMLGLTSLEVYNSQFSFHNNSRK